MKYLLALLTLLPLTGMYGCQNANDKDDESIQREEEIDRDDVIERRNMETPDQMDLDRDVMDVDDFKLDK